MQHAYAKVDYSPRLCSIVQCQIVNSTIAAGPVWFGEGVVVKAMDHIP